MALPKQRHTRHRRDRARRMLELKLERLTKCAKCGTAVIPHRVCPVCGTYRGLEVVKTGPKLKKEKKTNV